MILNISSQCASITPNAKENENYILRLIAWNVKCEMAVAHW